MDAINQGIYLDYASTSPLLDEVLEATQVLLPQFYANPDSLHTPGSKMAALQQRARKQIAGLLGCQDHEVIFTSGATEANNMAIKGIALANQAKGKHIVTTAIEHKSVMSAITQLVDHFGFECTILPVDAKGNIDLHQLEASLRKDTILVSVMAVNNEIGTVFPIDTITQIVKRYSKAYMHVDYVQALGKIELQLQRVDAASFSGHKIGGLKGSGVLFKGQNVPMLPLLSGGQQENYQRSGTSNAIANITFAKAMRLAIESQPVSYRKATRWKQWIISECKQIEGWACISAEDASPFIISMAYPKVPSQIMLNALDQKGIYVSAISTCSTKSQQVSYVHQAIGLSDDRSRSVIRVSLSSMTKDEDVEAFIQAYKEVIFHGYST